LDSDHAVFLDLAPDAAVSRVKGRGAKVDRHENPVDLSTAREGYLRVLEVVKRTMEKIRRTSSRLSR